MAERRDRNRPGPRVGENTRPPRYRLLAAAAALPQREPERPSLTFERDCPLCGRTVTVVQTETEDGAEYAFEDHDCVDPGGVR